VEVFREVRRVLHKSGSAWINCGDTYAGGGRGPGGEKQATNVGACNLGRMPDAPGLKPKDLVGIPWRLAFALQADGWYLRSDIIWAKRNPMPESVTDRPTKAHEYVFLLTKEPRYYYDLEAVREPLVPHADHKTARKESKTTAHVSGNRTDSSRGEPMESNPSGRNLRSVWQISSEPSHYEHYAAYPRKLVEPCIKAGSSERGCCPTCLKPWVRVVERKFVGSYHDHKGDGVEYGLRQGGRGPANDYVPPRTLGWRPSCSCPIAEPVPCTILDPFSGTGTTGVVALELGRNYCGIELLPKHAQYSRKRLAQVMPLFGNK